MTGNSLFTLWQLTLRDFRIRYRNMSLGILWSVLNPLVMVTVLTFVFTRVFPNPGVKSFPVFILCGLLPHSFMATVWSSGATSLFYNAILVKRVRLPRVLLPLASVFSSLLHFGIQLGLLVGYASWVGVLSASSILWVVPSLLVLMIFVTGLSLGSSILDVYIRDTRYLVESACLILFWLTPIFYSPAMVPVEIRPFYGLNPLVGVTLGLRCAFLGDQPPAAGLLAPGLIVAFLTLVVGLLLFKRFEPGVAEHL